MKAIIVSPSLNPALNVSGVSAVTQFIIDHCTEVEYTHFTLGRADHERGGWRRLPALCRRIQAWKNLLKENPGTLVHYNFPLSRFSILRDPFFINLARKAGNPLVIHIHGGFYLKENKVPWVLDKMLQWAFKGKDPIVVLSDTEREIMEHHGVKNVEVLPNCVPLDNAKSFQHQVPEGPLSIGYLGRIAKTKGMSEFLQACRSLRARAIPFNIALAGCEENVDEYVPVFAREFREKFNYYGIVHGNAKDTFLEHTDVFVLPSYFEGLPMSLLESMSFGCVPVVTNVGSVPTVVEDGVNGFLIEPHNAHAVTEAIARLHADRDLWQLLSNKAKETVFEKFSPTEYSKKLVAIYDKALKNV